MAAIDDTSKYYQDLLAYQYVNDQTNRDTIDALVRCALCDLVILDIANSFDLATAEGAQLDIIGKYIGFSRLIAGVVDRDYWRLADYTTYNPLIPVTGLTDYTDPTVNETSVFYNYRNTSKSFSTLEDRDYRQALYLVSATNVSDGSLASIQDIISTFFSGSLVVYDGQDMTMGYYVSGNISSSIQIAASQGLLPKPLGVLLTGVFKVADAQKVFGLQDYLYDNGNNVGLSDYQTGFNDRYLLSYTDKIY